MRIQSGFGSGSTTLILIPRQLFGLARYRLHPYCMYRYVFIFHASFLIVSDTTEELWVPCLSTTLPNILLMRKETKFTSNSWQNYIWVCAYYMYADLGIFFCLTSLLFPNNAKRLSWSVGRLYSTGKILILEIWLIVPVLCMLTWASFFFLPHVPSIP
jgi:hypothetical protein